MRSLFKSKPAQTPLISVIIISYNMAREIPRTVQSFLPPYQRGISANEVEIIVMENGSPHPVDPDIVDNWPDNVRYISVADPHPSPARALNEGVAMARGQWVCPVIDGARMVTPGLLRDAKTVFGVETHPFIASLGYHLGHEIQQLNVAKGYNQEVEDKMLADIGWPENPYGLFDISCLGGSARGAWLTDIAESNAPILKKETYNMLGGYDEGFDIPGGGLVNLDFFKRMVEHAQTTYFLLISEASFHQYHGGVTTSRPVSAPSLEDEKKTTWELYQEQYQVLRGEPYSVPHAMPRLYGEMNAHARKTTLEAANHIVQTQGLG